MSAMPARYAPEGKALPALRRAFARASAAHVVIDIQNCYCDPAHADFDGAADTQGMARLVEDIAAFSQRVRAVLPPVWVAHTNWATITHKEKKPFLQRLREGFGFWAGNDLPAAELRQRTRNEAALRELYRQPVAENDPVVGKHGMDAFAGTDLDALLKARGVDTLVLTGVFADQCVRATAESAVKNGYNVYIVNDLTLSGFDQAGGYVAPLANKGVRFITAAALGSALG
jgi:nicotinamidase-related amidase